MNPLPNFQTFREQAAQDAVDRLGLLRSEAAITVLLLLENVHEVHPKAICTAYRKRGEQLSDGEKKALGLRKNVFMSRAALAEVSDAGIGDPIRAHELTVLRASFGLFRYRNALSAERMMREHADTPIEVQYDVFDADACHVCKALHRKPVPSDWGLFAPTDCTCVTAPFGLHFQVDWLGNLIDVKRSIEGASKPSLISKIKRLLGLSLSSE